MASVRVRAPRCKKKGGTMSGTKPITFATLLIAIGVLLFCHSTAIAQSTSSNAQAQPSTGQQDQPITDEDIQMLRKNLRSQRKQVIAANMKLTDAEAGKFWPVYDQYISELVKINGTKYELIKRYVQTQGQLTDAQADDAVKQWIGVDQAVGDLRLKYIPLFRKVLSPKNTALFYQIDRRIQLMIDLQLASALPLVEP
jgi:hypothetical protein